MFSQLCAFTIRDLRFSFQLHGLVLAVSIMNYDKFAVFSDLVPGNVDFLIHVSL